MEVKKKNKHEEERKIFSCEIKMSGLAAWGLVTSEDTF